MKINLKKIREDRNISQTKLAELIGTKQNYISEIESGKKIPSLKMLKKIADTFEICTALLIVDNKYCSCPKCKETNDNENER